MGILTNRNVCRGKLILCLFGLVFLAGVPLGPAENQDIEQLREAAQQGDAEAQAQLGLMYDEG